MSYEDKCGKCENYSFKGDNSKGYCSWYKTYYYPDDSCPHQKNKYEAQQGCYLTTIICNKLGYSDKTISDAQNLINKGNVSYIYSFKGEKLSENAQKLLDNNPSNLKKLELNKLDNISDSDRNNKKTYISIMNENLELLKQELYQ